MRVDLATWCEILRKYPLRFKYEGLDGYGTDVRIQASRDEQYMDRQMEAVEKGYRDYAESDYLEEYTAFLWGLAEARPEIPPAIKKRSLSPKHTLDELRMLEEWLEDIEPCRYTSVDLRELFAADKCGDGDDWQFIRDCVLDEDEGYLLKKYPPEMVWNEAYGCGFPVENIVYICPSCGRHAMTTDELKDNGRHHYCSLCGSEYLVPHDFSDPKDLASFVQDLEITLWPLGRVFTPGSKVWAIDREDERRSGWKTVVEELGGTVVLDDGIEYEIQDCIPDGLLSEEE